MLTTVPCRTPAWGQVVSTWWFLSGNREAEVLVDQCGMCLPLNCVTIGSILVDTGSLGPDETRDFKC